MLPTLHTQLEHMTKKIILRKFNTKRYARFLSTYAVLWVLYSFGILYSTNWQLATNILWPIGCPEMSMSNYQSKLFNTPEQQRSHLHHDESLKSHKAVLCFCYTILKQSSWQPHSARLISVWPSLWHLPRILRYSNPVPKHVEFNTCLEFHFIKCIC
jgi:hypothetical protein